jgi:high-affinity Fe2+/Pb2+ permease
MDKFLLSTPGLIITGIGCLAILWLIGKLLGASFFFIAAIVIVFLILLIAYLVIRLHDEPLLEKIEKCLGMADSDKEEEN